MRKPSIFLMIMMAWVLWAQNQGNLNFFDNGYAFMLKNPWSVHGGFESKDGCKQALDDKIASLSAKENYTKMGARIVRVEKLVERQIATKKKGWIGSSTKYKKKKVKSASYLRLLCLPATVDPRLPYVNVDK